MNPVIWERVLVVGCCALHPIWWSLRPRLFFFFFYGVAWLVEAEIPCNSHYYQSTLSEVVAVRVAVTGFIYKPGMQLQ